MFHFFDAEMVWSNSVTRVVTQFRETEFFLICLGVVLAPTMQHSLHVSDLLQLVYICGDGARQTADMGDESFCYLLQYETGSKSLKILISVAVAFIEGYGALQWMGHIVSFVHILIPFEPAGPL